MIEETCYPHHRHPPCLNARIWHYSKCVETSNSNACTVDRILYKMSSVPGNWFGICSKGSITSKFEYRDFLGLFSFETQNFRRTCYPGAIYIGIFLWWSPTDLAVSVSSQQTCKMPPKPISPLRNVQVFHGGFIPKRLIISSRSVWWSVYGSISQRAQLKFTRCSINFWWKT